MNRFQPFSFSSVEELLGQLPPEEYAIVMQLRKLLFSCIPDIREKLTYNVPFYYRHSRICYIWPGSIPWGNKPKEGVDFGFCKAYLLTDTGYLDKGKRKEIYIRTFHHVKEIDRSALEPLLLQAMLIDADGMRPGK